MRIAATGLTSGVGLRLAEVARAQGLPLAGIVRNDQTPQARHLEQLGVTLIRGELSDERALSELASGADVFVHMAAQVGDQGTHEDYRKVNVGGTRNALVASARAKVPMFVQLSSTAVYGNAQGTRVTEDFPVGPSGIPYDDTKAEAEQLAFALGREHGFTVMAVRPPMIYGAHDKNFVPRLVTSVRTGKFVLFDGGRARWNLVWVDHVVDVMLRAARRADLGSQAFNVMDEVDASPPTVREVVQMLADKLGMAPPKLSLGSGVARAVARPLEAAYRVFGARHAPPLTEYVIHAMTRDALYDSSKAVAMLAWQPQKRALEGLAEAVDSYLATRRAA